MQKEAVLAEDIRAMVVTLGFDLWRCRDHAVLLVSCAGGLWRSEIVRLNHGKDDTPYSCGRFEILAVDAILYLRGKTARPNRAAAGVRSNRPEQLELRRVSCLSFRACLAFTEIPLRYQRRHDLPQPHTGVECCERLRW